MLSRDAMDCTLDSVVIVKRPDSISRKPVNQARSDSPNKKVSLPKARDDEKGRRRCRCQHGDAVRQRHNATQTPDSVLSWSQLHSCHGHSTAIDCCGNHQKSNSCCGLINGNLKSGEITCHCHITHHCHHYSPGSGGGGDSRHKKQCERRSRSSRAFHQRHHRHQHHHHHHNYRHLQPEYDYRNKSHNVRQLPGYNSKSSYDSSDDLQQSGVATGQERLHEIAIEIDAATMTEDNTSTATSNFAYKMAMGSIEPIIMAPLHDNGEDGKKKRQKQPRRRCDSMNSNSTVETDELSKGNLKDSNGEETAITNSLITGPHKNAHHTLWGSRDINDYFKQYIRTETKTDTHIQDKITPHMVFCDDSLCCITSGEMSKQDAAHNECVKIRRKLFNAGAAEDCCSTCSHCSNCSCQNADATSCSSIDDLDADDNDEERRTTPHELVVSAECHRCNLRRRSTTSTGEEAEEEVDTDKLTTADMGKQTVQENASTDSSTHTSRRSSASFCSCHSSTCCCCECECAGEGGDDDCETATTGQMHTARDTSCTALTSVADFDAEHSSTLTPLTNASSVASTPGAEDADVTLRSFNNTLTEDIASSLSQSAEYFSLSSGNHQSQKSPTETPTRRKLKMPSEITAAESELKTNDITTTSRKPCKHYIKHHRHKRATSPLDCYL